MARPKDKENEIIDAAMKVLKKGFLGTSIQNIATEAKIGKGTVYVYFKSKNELFLQLIKADMLNISMKYKQKYLHQGLFLNRIMAFIELSQAIMLDNFARHRYYMTESYLALSHETQVEVIKIIDESKKECENIIVDILKQGANEGLVRDDDIRFNAYMLQDLILNYAERCSNTKLSDEQKKEDQVKLINIIMRGIGGK